MDYKIRVHAERRETIDIDKLTAAILRLARERAAAEAKANERRKAARRAS